MALNQFRTNIYELRRYVCTTMMADDIRIKSASISFRVHTCRLCSMFSTFCVNCLFYDKPERCRFYLIFGTPPENGVSFIHSFDRLTRVY